MRTVRRCDVDGCESKHLAKGYCRAHYLRKYKHGSLEKLTMRGEPVLDRIMAKVTVTDAGYKTACWIFGGTIAENGYGGIRHEGKMRRVHVVTYEAKNGPVPDGLELDHLCRVRPCCNPDHVEPVTHLENIRRSSLVGRVNNSKRNSLGQFMAEEKGFI